MIRNLHSPRFAIISAITALTVSLAAAFPCAAVAQADRASEHREFANSEASQDSSEIAERGETEIVQDLADKMAANGRLTSQDVKGVAPADIEAAGRLLRERHSVVATDNAGSKPTGAGLIMRGRVGNDLTPGSEEADATDAMNMEAQAVASHRASQAAAAKAPWYAKLGETLGASWGIMFTGLIGLAGFVTSWILYKNRKRNVRD